LKRLIVHKAFDYSVLFFIALNCITLAMERPSIPPTSFVCYYSFFKPKSNEILFLKERQFLNITNYIFTVIFGIEMMIKIIASGLVYGPHTYLHTGWNVMDGSLVIISIVDIATMNRSGVSTTTVNVESDAATRLFSMLRVFRLLRTLRPLRGKE
jgi:voltage-dependent calcium channel T type alpha-1G